MHPTRTSTLALVIAGVVLFLISPIGQDGSGSAWIGNIGWFGFLACLLLLIASGLYALSVWIRQRGRLSAQ